MLGRKILGFIVGFSGCMLLILWLFSGTHSRPVGGGWGWLSVLAGMYTARRFSQPREPTRRQQSKEGEKGG